MTMDNIMATSSTSRVYIPTNARNNQYLLAEFKPSNEFMSSFDSIDDFYDRVSRKLFIACEENGLYNVHMIANDKLPITRFHEESYCLQTEKQMIFFYNPRYHEGHKSYWQQGVRAKKISLLFLATGDSLRENAAAFHNKVLKTLKDLKSKLGISDLLRVRDHQHLTYDLFSRAKGHKETYGFKLRSLYPRYEARNCRIPDNHSEMTYVTFHIPVTRSLKTNFPSLFEGNHYEKFYKFVEDKFFSACSFKQITLASMVADGRLPLVRNSKTDQPAQNSELQKLSFDISSDETQLKSQWNKNQLVDTLHFVVVAKYSVKKDVGYGKFMNNVEGLIRNLSQSLEISAKDQVLNVRFFQHISYNV